MAGLDFSKQDDKNELKPVSRKQVKIGWMLFFVYCVLYGAYVFVNAFAANFMQSSPLAGVNNAVLSGIGLIAAAFVIALIYEWICNRLEAKASQESEASK